MANFTPLSDYPKARPALPPAFAAIYEKQYAENRHGGSKAASLAQMMEQWLHRSVAADAHPMKRTLELGAGTLNQLPFEPKGGLYDIVEPMRFLYEDSPHRLRVNKAFDSIHDIPETNRYDRITSCAVLEHVCDLPHLLARSALLLNKGGTFRASIPSEGGLLWNLGWRLTTGLEFRLRHGLDYGVLMKHEHVNTAADIESLVLYFFRNVKIKSFGIGRQLSLYRFIEAREPYDTEATHFLAKSQTA